MMSEKAAFIYFYLMKKEVSDNILDNFDAEKKKKLTEILELTEAGHHSSRFIDTLLEDPVVQELTDAVLNDKFYKKNISEICKEIHKGQLKTESERENAYRLQEMNTPVLIGEKRDIDTANEHKFDTNETETESEPEPQAKKRKFRKK
jgi:hypothetical protein